MSSPGDTSPDGLALMPVTIDRQTSAGMMANAARPATSFHAFGRDRSWTPSTTTTKRSPSDLVITAASRQQPLRATTARMRPNDRPNAGSCDERSAQHIQVSEHGPAGREPERANRKEDRADEDDHAGGASQMSRDEQSDGAGQRTGHQHRVERESLSEVFTVRASPQHGRQRGSTDRVVDMRELGRWVSDRRPHGVRAVGEPGRVKPPDAPGVPRERAGSKNEEGEDGRQDRDADKPQGAAAVVPRPTSLRDQRHDAGAVGEHD